jgi:hypothetical protein
LAHAHILTVALLCGAAAAALLTGAFAGLASTIAILCAPFAFVTTGEIIGPASGWNALPWSLLLAIWIGAILLCCVLTGGALRVLWLAATVAWHRAHRA